MAQTEKEQPVLETNRLVLRPFFANDAPTVQRLAGAPEVADMTLNIPHPYPDGAAEQWIGSHRENFSSGRAVSFAIVLQETGELCGAIGLGITKGHRRAEMGYWLGVPYWNRGYMTEAASTLLAYGFGTLELHRLYAHHFPRNPASGRVLQKIGMKFEGILREHVRKGDGFEDLAVYGLLRPEWHMKE